MAEPNADDNSTADSPTKTVMMDESSSKLSEDVSVSEALEQLDEDSTETGPSGTLPFDTVADALSAELADAESAADDDLGDDNDPSVEAYVAGLIARSKGDEDPKATVSFQPGMATGPPPQTKSANEPMKLATKPRETVRSEPEGREVITNLRDLANMNTRSVLDIHSGQRLIVQMHSKLAVALVSIIFSFAMVSMAKSSGSLAFFASICALTASIVWSTQYLRLARQLREACQQTEELNSVPE